MNEIQAIRDAMRYAAGYDVAGWPAHLRPNEIQARCDAALDALEVRLHQTEEDLRERQAAWKKLRRKVQREQRVFGSGGSNKEHRTISAALNGAYGGVLRMMDSIEGRSR